MKKETRRQKLLDLWDDDVEVVTALKEALPKETLDQYVADEDSREAEALLAFFRCPEYFQFDTCQQCNKPFTHTYGKIAFCSNRCRRKALEDKGIEWDVTKSPQERWRPAFVDETRQKQGESQEDFLKRQSRLQGYYPVPLVIPSEAVDALSKMLVSQGVLPQPVDISQESQQAS